MPALLAPLLPLALGAGLVLTHDLGLRAEARTQALRPSVGAAQSRSAVDLQLQGGLVGESRTLDVDLAYAPTVTHQWGDGPDRDSVLHLASGAARWRASPTWRLHAEGRFSRGVTDLFRPAPAGGPADQPGGSATPIASTIRHERADLALGAEGDLAARLRLSTTLGATREGGLGEAGLAVVPLQQVGRAGAELAWQATRNATLGGWGSGEVAHFFDVRVADPVLPGGVAQRSWSAWSGRLGGVWRWAFSREGRTWAALGAAVAGGDGPGQPALRLRPTGQLGVGLEPEAGSRRPRLEARLAAEPAADRTSGLVSTRAELGVVLAWAPAGRWTVDGSLSGARIMDGPTQRDAYAAGELRVGWVASDQLRLVVGGRGTAQRAPRLQPRPATEWVAFCAVEASRRGRP